MNDEEYFNKVHGGWIGRVAGSQFGAPLEFKSFRKMQKKYCEGGKKEITDYIKPVKPTKINDDEIYEIVGLLTLEEKGIDITSKDIAEGWAKYLYLFQFTAERIGKRNIKRGIMPPESGTHKNFYFDFIGGQMKADIWGLIAPNLPDIAAKYAKIDGEVAHSGIGIDGEVFVATMISNAFSMSADKMDLRSLIEKSMKYISSDSQYFQFVETAIRIYEKQIDWKSARSKLMEKWERIRLDLKKNTSFLRKNLALGLLKGVHVLPNAAIIVLSLLYGENDKLDPFGRPICLAGMMALDTDCNCGNIGTIMGTIMGAEKIPLAWSSPLQNTFRTYVKGHKDWKIDDLSRRICNIGNEVISNKLQL